MDLKEKLAALNPVTQLVLDVEARLRPFADNPAIREALGCLTRARDLVGNEELELRLQLQSDRTHYLPEYSAATLCGERYKPGLRNSARPEDVIGSDRPCMVCLEALAQMGQD